MVLLRSAVPARVAIIAMDVVSFTLIRGSTTPQIPVIPAMNVRATTRIPAATVAPFSPAFQVCGVIVLRLWGVLVVGAVVIHAMEVVTPVIQVQLSLMTLSPWKFWREMVRRCG